MRHMVKRDAKHESNGIYYCFTAYGRSVSRDLWWAAADKLNETKRF